MCLWIWQVLTKGRNSILLAHPSIVRPFSEVNQQQESFSQQVDTEGQSCKGLIVK